MLQPEHEVHRRPSSISDRDFVIHFVNLCCNFLNIKLKGTARGLLFAV